MSTRVTVSAVFDIPIDQVWSNVRDFTFPAKYFESVSGVKIQDDQNPSMVGAIRVLSFKDSEETRSQRLIELSDLHYKICWELISVEPTESEVVGSITEISLTRITENNTTLVSWQSDFSSDVQPDLIKFEQNSYLQNLQEMRQKMSK